MPNTDKIFRDPLYNYVAVDRGRDGWLVDLIDSPEIQRLRRIHQLGVSHFTYPGADHSRFSHTLGVLHLMQHACRRVEVLEQGPRVERARHLLLAAAVLHDVGHGPFSHLFEPALGIDHEDWSCKIISCPQGSIQQKLAENDIPVEQVIALIQKDNHQRPPWQKTLLSSELDVDRIDYLRRDSYFTGAGYGHFDWYRILNSFTLHTTGDRFDILVWPSAAMYPIEEYIFSRFYMYNAVYQHKTTRGFELLVRAAWKRARELSGQGSDAYLVHEIAEFLNAGQPTVQQYLAMEDATLVYQMQVWMRHPDRVLSDLARRFLVRDRFAALEDPVSQIAFPDLRDAWEKALGDKVAEHGFEPEYYALRDDLKLTVYNPYLPEKEEPEQDPYNAIFVQPDPRDKPREISTILTRLAPVTGAREKRYRYYVPRECRDAVRTLADSRKW
ncbi:MAG TPA: HD domain-containing protein [Bryobacteraceae bacterium]|nr:HD domain-containing protein [Bryobacteraceae bacterium]